MNTEIKIEKGIPMPSRGRFTGVTEILKKLNVGDSFVAEAKHISNFHSYARGVGIKIRGAKIGDQQFRIWRIA